MTNPFRRPVGWFAGVLIVIAITGIVTMVSYQAWHERDSAELTKEGDVTVMGDGYSSFAEEYRTAAEFVASGKSSEAEKIYRELLKREPNSPNPLVGLASSLMSRGDYVEARRLCEQALAIAPNSVNAHVALGTAYADMSEFAKAIEQYNAALAIDDQSPEAHWGLALAYADVREKNLSRHHLSRFKQLRSNSRHLTRLEEIINK
jgi:tetratricopeptide (TPR) repeat protein